MIPSSPSRSARSRFPAGHPGHNVRAATRIGPRHAVSETPGPDDAAGTPDRPAERPADRSAERPRGRYCGLVRVATWNVNSVRQRVPRLLPWLDERQPDVVCLQETKLTDEAFGGLLGAELADAGLRVGRPRRRRSGTASRSCRGWGSRTCARACPAAGLPRPEARAVSASCGGIRVHSVYVPNGRMPDSEHYRYKLAWLAALRDGGRRQARTQALVCGDMNIAPADADVFDPAAYVGQTHVTPPERAALAELQALGLRDVVRDRWPDEPRVHLLGLPGRHVPPGSRDAHRPDPGQRRRWPPGCARRGWTARRARAARRAITRRSSSTWTRRRTATSGRSSRRRRPARPAAALPGCPSPGSNGPGSNGRRQ